MVVERTNTSSQSAADNVASSAQYLFDVIERVEAQCVRLIRKEAGVVPERELRDIAQALNDLLYVAERAADSDDLFCADCDEGLSFAELRAKRCQTCRTTVVAEEGEGR